MWDISTSNITQQKIIISHKDWINSITSNEHYLFTACRDGTINIWNSHSLAQMDILKGHTASVNTVICSQNYLFSGSSDRTVKIWSCNKT